MRILLGVVVVFVLAYTATAADEKIDAKKLIGKWGPKMPKKGENRTVEFAPNGKLLLWEEVDGKEMKIEGTYKLEGNKVSFKMKFMDLDVDDTVTITKLTDDELEGKDKEGKVEVFKRVIPKK
jgi:uncharacterized protein (TIGR03066 family)